MRQTRKQFYTRLVALAAALLILLGAAPAARAASGTCGDGVTWTLTGGVLTISGSGAMADYEEERPAPWSDMEVTAVRIEDGVTSVGELAFFRMDSISAVTLADSVTDIGWYAFFACSSLTLLDLGHGVANIGQSAFEKCISLISLRLPESLQSLGYQAFYCCESLQSVTVPSSVTHMDGAVFAHCTGLHSAIVNARIKELPVWTFYGCTALEQVVLCTQIQQTGVEAFEGSAMTSPPVRGDLIIGGTVSHSSVTQDAEGNDITKDFFDSGDSIIIAETNTSGQTTIDAVLDNSQGWEDLGEQITENPGSTQVQVQLKGEPTLSAEDLNQFASTNIQLQIQTGGGVQWNINGADLPAGGVAGESYNLSCSLTPLTDPNKKQEKVIGDGKGFVVVFDSSIDFKTEIVLSFGVDQKRNTADFLVKSSDGYTSLQQVLIDDNGLAHFYLEQVEGNTEYLIGIGISAAQQDAAPIIPDSLKSDYGVDEQEQIEYVVTGVKSSWGMDIGQVTWILAGVMGGSILVVGIAVGLMNKRKLKKGYVPDLDNA